MDMAALLLALCTWLPEAQQAGPSQGTTLPLNRDLAAKAADAEAFLAEGRIAAGLTLLQEIAEAEPTSLVPTEDGMLFRGAAAKAIERLSQLPPELQAEREKLYGARAAQELRAALDPPDLLRLEALARRYAGLEAGARARLAAAEIWLDRGQLDHARRLDPERRLPQISDERWAVADPEAAQRLPAVKDLSDPQLPFLDTTTLQPLWSRDFEDRSRREMLVRHRLAIGGGIVYATDGYEVLALEAGSGRELWRYQADERWDRMEGAERLRDAISEHVLTAPVLAEGILLAVVHEAEPLGRLDSYMRIPIRRLMPARRLIALDAHSGKLLWKMRTAWSEGRAEPREIASGPPAVFGGRVFLPVYDAVGTIDFSLVALDLASGKTLWRRYLSSGQLETNLFGNVLIELATPPPLADPDRVMVCSHLGSFHALDPATGAVLWTRAYPRLQVRPSETGRIADRMQLLGRNLGASDGRRVAWAPVDGDAISLLDAVNGSLLASWPSWEDAGRHLFTLLGMQDDGVWAAGSRLALLRMPDGPSSLYSEALYEEGGMLQSSRSGALLQSQILLPLQYDAVESFHPARLSPQRRVLDFSSSQLDSGALQAAPGLLFVERPEGISAYGSLGSIAAILQSANLDPVTLTEVLPVALNLDFGAEPKTARQIAETAAKLAAQPAFARQNSRLRLLSARCWLQAGELDRAEPQLLKLLEDTDQELSETACGLLLDDPFLLEPLRPGVERALAAASAWPERSLRLHDGSSAPVAAILARARALRALAGDRLLNARRTLTDLLRLEETGALHVDGQPVQEWAQAALTLVLRDPAERAAYEQDGRDILAGTACSAEILRAFGDSAAAQEALLAEVERTDLPRAQQIVRSRWRREHGQPDRAWPDLLRWFPAATPLPQAPRGLVPVSTRRIAGASPLLVRSNAAGLVKAWVPRRDGVQLLSFADVALELHAYPLPGRRLGGAETIVPTTTGCAILLRDRIVHLGEDGSLDELPLPAYLADNAQSLAIGDGLLALVLQAQPGFLRLVVLDARTGVSYLEQDLPGHPGRRIELRQEGSWLYILEENAALAYRVNLHFAQPPLAFALASPMNGVDLPTTTVADGALHYLINRNNPAIGTMLRAEPGSPPLQLPFENQFVKRVRVAPGLAWLLQAPSRSTVAPPRALYWMTPGQDQPREILLGSPDARVLQLVDSEYKRVTDPVPTEVLVLSPAADGSTRVEAYRASSERPLWACALPDVPFEDLNSMQPSSRQAADGWVLPLLLRPNLESGPRLELRIIEADGRLRASARADWAGTAVDQVRIDLLPGALLLRNGDTLTLYSGAP
jgi:hypothetical protein